MPKIFSPGASAAAIRLLASGRKLTKSQLDLAREQAIAGADLLKELDHPANVRPLELLRVGVRLDSRADQPSDLRRAEA